MIQYTLLQYTLILFFGFTPFILCIAWAISMSFEDKPIKKDRSNKRAKKKENKYSKIHPEYKGLVKELLKEKEEKELLLTSIKLLDKELESVKRLDEEIKGLLK